MGHKHRGQGLAGDRCTCRVAAPRGQPWCPQSGRGSKAGVGLGREEGAADTSPGSPESGQWLEGHRLEAPCSHVHSDGQGPAQGGEPGAWTPDAQGQEERRTRRGCVRWQLGRYPWKSPLRGFCFLSERGSRALLLGEKVRGSRRRRREAVVCPGDSPFQKCGRADHPKREPCQGPAP